MVGSAVVRALKQSGFTNLVLKKRAELDLLNQSAVELFFKKEKPQYVIHCAAHVGGIRASINNPAGFLYENLQIQNNVIWQAHLHDTEKLLFLGSSCIYPRESLQPMKEEYLLTGPLEPTNEGYALAKIAGMKLCEAIYTQYKKTFISCMPTNIYGEGDNFNVETSHVIPALVRNMHEAKINNQPEVTVWGSGKVQREFLYVDDLAAAVVWLMEHYTDNKFLNVGTGHDVTIQELAEKIKHIVRYHGNLVFDTSKPDGMPRKLLDVEKIHALGWKHTVDLNEGLKKTYRIFLEQYT